MSAEAVKKLSFEIAPSEEESEATIEQQDVACGLENLPVSLWPLGAGPRPKPFQVKTSIQALSAAHFLSLSSLDKLISPGILLIM
nr:histone-lysine N-methyltransferase SETMAR isoform X2 [Rattus norvegicus]